MTNEGNQPNLSRTVEIAQTPESVVIKLNPQDKIDLAKFEGIDPILWEHILHSIEDADLAYAIACGNKTLILIFEDDNASTTLFTNELPRMPGATSKIYLSAKKLMQDQANQLKTPIQYRFRTFNDQMKQWARSEGNKIFNWKAGSKSFSDPDDEKKALEFNIEFLPENQPTQQ